MWHVITASNQRVGVDVVSRPCSDFDVLLSVINRRIIAIIIIIIIIITVLTLNDPLNVYSMLCLWRHVNDLHYNSQDMYKIVNKCQLFITLSFNDLKICSHNIATAWERKKQFIDKMSAEQVDKWIQEQHAAATAWWDGVHVTNTTRIDGMTKETLTVNA